MGYWGLQPPFLLRSLKGKQHRYQTLLSVACWVTPYLWQHWHILFCLMLINYWSLLLVFLGSLTMKVLALQNKCIETSIKLFCESLLVTESWRISTLKGIFIRSSRKLGEGTRMIISCPWRWSSSRITSKLIQWLKSTGHTSTFPVLPESKNHRCSMKRTQKPFAAFMINSLAQSKSGPKPSALHSQSSDLSLTFKINF